MQKKIIADRYLDEIHFKSDVYPNTNIKSYTYKNYAEYIYIQRARALRTRKATRGRMEDRELVGRHLKDLVPTARTMLCIGARDDSEVEHFEKMGYEVCGIDLYPTKRIIKCDMSRMQLHPDLKGRSFDVFVAIHSIEHCLDFEGFRPSLAFCRQAVVCITPLLTTPNAWDCTAFRFAHPKATEQDIVEAFPEFSVAWRSAGGDCLRFLALRKNDLPVATELPTERVSFSILEPEYPTDDPSQR